MPIAYWSGFEILKLLSLLYFMHQSIETPVPRPPRHGGDLARPQQVFNGYLTALLPQGAVNLTVVYLQLGSMCRDLTVHDSHGRGNERGFNRVALTEYLHMNYVEKYTVYCRKKRSVCLIVMIAVFLLLYI